MTKVGFRQKSAAGGIERHTHIEAYTIEFIIVMGITWQVGPDKICPNTREGIVIVK